jgi:hypothetical protein
MAVAAPAACPNAKHVACTRIDDIRLLDSRHINQQRTIVILLSIQSSPLRQLGFILIMITSFRQYRGNSFPRVLHGEHQGHGLRQAILFSSGMIRDTRIDRNPSIARTIDKSFPLESSNGKEAAGSYDQAAAASFVIFEL